MDLLSQYITESELSTSNILRLVDEYTLYAYYLEFTPETHMRYTSPIKAKDDNPSFTVFYSRHPQYEFFWKDHALNQSGTIFKLIKLMYGLKDINEALCLVDTDFELGLRGGKSVAGREKIVRYAKPEDREPIAIKVKRRAWKQKDVDYWEQQGISLKTLDYYDVTPIEFFWTRESQKAPISAKELAYAYKIGAYYKIYQPREKEYKFLNNFPEHFIEGWVQLDWTNTDLLIITKSMKEVMWFRENLLIEAVAGKSETQMVPENLIRKFQERFKHIVVFLDPDDAGYRQAKKYEDLYGFPWVTIHPELETGCKDPTDHNKMWGREATKKMVIDVLSPCYTHLI